MNKLILILVAAVALDIAPHLFRQAAEQGHADAQYALGLMYANGSGVLKDATLGGWVRDLCFTLPPIV